MDNKIDIKISNSIKLNGEYSCFVSFEYDSDIIECIRQFPSRYYNKDTKCWEIPLNKLKVIVDTFSNNYEIHIYGDYVDLTPVNVQLPKQFNYKTKPYNHQIEGVNYGLAHNNWLLGDEQGLGKTKQVIDIAVAEKLKNNYQHCLIVCGVNTLKWNWYEEVRIHSNEKARLIGMKPNGKIGSSADKLNDLINIDKIKEYFLIINVESLRNQQIVDNLQKLCKNKTIGIVAVDEIHRCKNPTSQQGKGLLKLNAEHKIAMTGTPLMNTPLDLFVILKWLGFEKHSFYAFKKHFCNMGGFGGYEIIGYKNLNELQETLNDIMLRRLKQDVVDLPDKIYVNEFVELTPKQEQIYKEVKNEVACNIDKIKASNNPLAELIRMRQATGYTGILSSTIKESGKIDRLEELVEDAVSNGDKVIIFSNWTAMTTPIYEKLSKKYKGVVITGETKDNERQQNVNKFQTNETCKFCLGTIGAMGTGLTLTAANTVIFIDEPWTMAAKQQAIDRAHRIGTKENVTIYTLMAKNTIDERIHELVEKKGAMSDAIVDNKIVGNKLELLEFLIN